MSSLPRPRRSTADGTPSLDASGLNPLHLDLHPKTTGLRPLGQVDGLRELEPTTAIFPMAEDNEKKGHEARRKQTLASSLDWNQQRQE